MRFCARPFPPKPCGRGGPFILSSFHSFLIFSCLDLFSCFVPPFLFLVFSSASVSFSFCLGHVHHVSTARSLEVSYNATISRSTVDSMFPQRSLVAKPLVHVSFPGGFPPQCLRGRPASTGPGAASRPCMVRRCFTSITDREFYV